MPVRAGLGIAEDFDEPFFDAVRDGVLENAGLSIDLIPWHAEHIGEQAFRQTVAAYDADGHFQTLARKTNVAAGSHARRSRRSPAS